MDTHGYGLAPRQRVGQGRGNGGSRIQYSKIMSELQTRGVLPRSDSPGHQMGRLLADIGVRGRSAEELEAAARRMGAGQVPLLL